MPIQGLAELNAEFARALREDLPREVRKRQRTLVIKILRGVVRRTPTFTGLARGNWQVTVGEPAEDVLGAEKSISAVVARGASALDGLRDYDAAWITNNAPHIAKLEFGGFVPRNPGRSKDARAGRKGRVLVRGGFSVLASRGMLRATLAEVGRSRGD